MREVERVRGEPQMMRRSVLWCQVCVPEDYGPEEIRIFAEREDPCGTRNGWQLLEEGHELLRGQPAAMECAERPGYVHRVLVA